MTNDRTAWKAAAVMAVTAALMGCSDEATDFTSPTCPRGQVAQGPDCVWLELTGSTTEDISFASGDVFILEGDITLPEASNATIFSAVLLLPDRGAQGRDGGISKQHEMPFGKSVRLFDNLRDFLVERGFAVMRYDSRTCFGENGCDNDYPTPPFSGIDYDDLLGDARAAALQLSQHVNVRAEDIVLLGHGDGGQLAAWIEQPVANDVVLFGASYEPIDANLAEQLATSVELLEEQGLPQSEIDSQTAMQAKTVEQLTDLRMGTFGGDTINGLSTDYWSRWMEIGDGAIERFPKASYGVLQLHGTYDLSVRDKAAGAFSKLMQDHPDTTYKLFPRLAHPLVRIVEEDWSQVEPGDVASSLDEILLGELSGWLFRETDGEAPEAP